MKRFLTPPIIISIVIVLIVMSATFYLLLKVNTVTTMPSKTSQASTSTKNEQPVKTTPKGAFIEYQDGIIASTKGEKLLFFHAPWCPQCRSLEADIHAKGVPQGTTIIKVNYDNSQSLKQKYDVVIQTTIVRIDDKGKLIKKFVAYDEPTLDAVIKGTR